MSLAVGQQALMQCRSGIARSGATRSDYYLANLAATIGGIDRSTKFRKRTVEVVDIINEQPDTASAVVYGFDPSEGQEIILGSGAINNRVFAGHITKATQLSVKKAAVKLWQIDCVDYTRMLNRRLVTKRYAAQAVHLIVIDLIANYTSGFTTTNVKTSSPVLTDAVEFVDVAVGEALTRLVNLVSTGAVPWHWYADYFKDIHFFDTETTQAPLDLTQTNYTYSNLQYARAIDEIRTRVFVEGGGGSATAPVAAGATSIPVDECAWYSATGGTVRSGANLCTYTGVSASSGPGNLTGVPGAGASSVQYSIKQGDEVNVRVQCDDAVAQATLAALEGGDGIHEQTLSDNRLSIAGATARGQAELSNFSTTDIQGSYESIDKFNRSGKSVTITRADRGIAVSVVLQKVTRRYVAQDKWGFTCEFQRIRSGLVDILAQARGLIGGGN
jgi:hypothetical protein